MGVGEGKGSGKWNWGTQELRRKEWKTKGTPVQVCDLRAVTCTGTHVTTLREESPWWTASEKKPLRHHICPAHLSLWVPAPTLTAGHARAGPSGCWAPSRCSATLWEPSTGSGRPLPEKRRKGRGRGRASGVPTGGPAVREGSEESWESTRHVFSGKSRKRLRIYIQIWN